MGYVADVDGPHPSTLPVWKWWDDTTWNAGVRCGHNGLMDGWRGDELAPSGQVWSCLQGCGRAYYPDSPDGESGRGGSGGGPGTDPLCAPRRGGPSSMANPSYTPGASQGGPSDRSAPTGTDGNATGLRSSNDRIPQNDTGVGQTARLAIGDKVRHRISGARGEVVDLHADPFVKEITHGVVNWTGDGDGFGQGYSNTNLVKF